MFSPKYCLFYDFHTMKSTPNVGEGFDIDSFTTRLKKCGVDYLVFHARCNQGFAYYNTRLGIKHPSLQYDLFGDLVENCNKKGIALGAYFNAGISNEEGLQHPEWTTLYFDGRSLREPRLTPHVRTMCYNSGYRKHLIMMVKEVVEKYPIAGLMIDCLISYPCVCPICIDEMKEKGIDWTDLNAVTSFSATSVIRLAKEIAEEVKKINPNLLISNNYPNYEDLMGINTYWDVICLPSSGTGYDFLPVMAHYVRTLNEKPVLNMTGRFYDWGDFGGLLPEEAIKSELLYGLANGMRSNIGSHLHPQGNFEDVVLDRIEAIYRDLQLNEEWYTNAKSVTEIAIVYPRDINNIRNDIELKSAVRILSELRHQFDVVTLATSWDKYEVLIFPDHIDFTNEIAQRVKEHIEKGKAVIATGTSGLDSEQSYFVLQNEWGVKYNRLCEIEPSYISINDNFNQGLSQMPLSTYCKGIDMEVLPKTTIEAYWVKPYQNRIWDGVYAVCYNPPQEVTKRPALTINGKIAHFSHKIFTGYFEKASVELRCLFSNVLNYFLKEPLLKVENLPTFCRIFITKQPNRFMIHLLSYIPEMRGKTPIIEEGIEIYNIKIKMRINKEIEYNVYSAPKKAALSHIVIGNYAEVIIPKSKGYSLIVFEENNRTLK